MFDFLEQILDIFKLKIEKEALMLLVKQKMKAPLALEIDGKLEFLDQKDFEKLFEVEYLPNLFFKDLTLLKTMVKKCKKAIKMGDMAEKETWLGTYFENEILNFLSPKVYLKWINEYKGYGLFALKDLKADTFIGEYTGFLRKYKRKMDEKNSYCFEYSLGLKKTRYTIDAKYMGNYVRFINHSFNPNITPHIAYCKGIAHVFLMSKEFIPKGTELTYDYGPRYWQKREKPLS
jgi:uncharacterized protein